MSDEKIIFESIGTNSLRTSAPYLIVFDYVRNVITTNGGKIKKDDMKSGTLEGAWKYGISFFGLRVTIQFRTIADGQIELHAKGGFVDAFDTTGAGEKKAQDILGLISGLTPLTASAIPPRLGDDKVENRGKKKTLAGILALLIGGFGAHKFYLGNWGLGVLYIASIFLIPYMSAIISGIEAIRFFTISENTFNEKYNYRTLHPFEFVW